MRRHSSHRSISPRRPARRRPVASMLLSPLLVLAAASLTTCSAADGLIGIHSAFLPGFNQVPAPTVTAADLGIQVGTSTSLTASGSGADAVYNWSISAGGGSIDPTGETVTFHASDTPETVTIAVYGSITGFQDSEVVETDILVSDLPFLDMPVIAFDEGTSTVFVGNTVNVSASGSGTGVTYNWSVDGAGSIGATGSTVPYSAPTSEETATISVFASADGFNDSPAATAAVAVRDNHFALLSSTASAAGANINQSGGSYLVWNTESIDSAFFSRPSTTELEVIQDGDYFVALTIPLETAVQRSSVRAEVHVNGSLYTGGIAESSYVRNDTGNHSESSDHLALLIPGLIAGDDIRIEVHEAASNGTVTISGQATLYVEHVDSSRSVFAARSAASMDTADLYVDPASAVPIEWQKQIADTGFTHSDVSTPERITLNGAGYYMVYANVPLYVAGPDISDRVNIELLVQLNGTTVDGGQAQQGYIRRQDGHQNSSLHWSGIVHSSSPNGALSFSAHKDSGASIADQTVTMNSKKATVFVERIDVGAFVFSGTATRPVTGTDFNSASSVAWESELVTDVITYSHSTALFDSDEITFNRSGDYLVVYNDAVIISGTDIRLNPRIELEINGTPVTGAQTKSHYLRNDASAGNFESSASLVFYLEGVAAGQSFVITTAEEAETASAAIADDFALLTIIRKR